MLVQFTSQEAREAQKLFGSPDQAIKKGLWLAQKKFEVRSSSHAPQHRALQQNQFVNTSAMDN